MAEGFDRSVRDALARLARAGELSEIIGGGAAGALAQDTAGGLGIQNIRRCVGFTTLTGLGANMTVAHATSGFAALSTPVSLEVSLSGRPLLIVAGLTVSAGASGVIMANFLLRKTLVTSAPNGAPGGYRASTTIEAIVPWWIVMSPSAGKASIDLVMDATTANGTVYADASNVIALAAVEL